MYLFYSWNTAFLPTAGNGEDPAGLEQRPFLLEQNFPWSLTGCRTVHKAERSHKQHLPITSVHETGILMWWQLNEWEVSLNHTVKFSPCWSEIVCCKKLFENEQVSVEISESWQVWSCTLHSLVNQRDALCEVFPCSIKKNNLLSCIYVVDRDCLTVMMDVIYKESYTCEAREKKKKRLHTFKGLHFRLWKDKKISFTKHY